MPKLSQKKVITLRARITKEIIEKIEVNPSVRLTAIQEKVNAMAIELMFNNPDCTVEVTAEGLI